MVYVRQPPRSRRLPSYLAWQPKTRRKSWEVIAESAGSLYLSMLDAMTGFNQLQNSDRARRVLAVITRSGQFLPTCLTFGPVNGPEAFAYVMDRVYARGSNRRSRAASEWLAYVDDHTIRSERMINGVAYRDSEVADRVRNALQDKAPPETCQDVAEALEKGDRRDTCEKFDLQLGSR